jgi:hypothetical protein
MQLRQPKLDRLEGYPPGAMSTEPDFYNISFSEKIIVGEVWRQVGPKMDTLQRRYPECNT